MILLKRLFNNLHINECCYTNDSKVSFNSIIENISIFFIFGLIREYKFIRSNSDKHIEYIISNKSLDSRENLICWEFKVTQVYVGIGFLYRVLLIISSLLDKKLLKFNLIFKILKDGVFNLQIKSLD